MGTLSAQTLALFVILSPGLLFLIGFNTSEHTSRQEGQRGIIIDTSLFVVISAFVHLCVGLLFLALLDSVSACSVVKTYAVSAGADIYHLGNISRCSFDTEMLVVVLYSVIVGGSSLALGRCAAEVIDKYPNLYTRLYGPFYEVTSHSSKGTVVKAAVMTDTEIDGKMLMYEGKLVELSVNSDRSINYVCLRGAERFYLGAEDGVIKTTPRNQFQPLESKSASHRFLVPGSRITNLFTTTYNITSIPSDIADVENNMVHRRRFLFWGK